MTTDDPTSDRAGRVSHYAVPATADTVHWGVTQVVDGNWGVHAILKKALFVGDPG
jgi:hypothetical protein